MMRRPLLALATACALSVAMTGVASASTWTGHQLTGEAAKVSIFGVSCPTASLCVAVGGNNTIASSTNPNAKGSWNVVYAGAGALPTTPNSVFPGRQIRGIACPSSQLCVAVTLEGDVYTASDPTGSAAAWSVTDADGGGANTHFYGVSCPSPALCVATAGEGRIATSTNPTAGPLYWSTTQLDESLELRGVSCAALNFCVAVGDFGQIVASSNPTGGASAWQQIPSPVGVSHLSGVSCALPSLCVTGNSAGNLISSTNPTDAAPLWKMVDGGGSVQITSASCISSTRCVAVDNNGDVLTSTDPTGGPDAWTFMNILPYPGVDETAANHLFGVSCPGTSFCAVAGNKGQVFTSDDPFATPPAPAQKKGKNRSRKRPKRPRTTIAHQPAPGIELRHGKYKARFRFFARNHAQVRGFACKIDGRPVKRCRSPKSYRVGVGRHVFRVHAIGWTGLKGPPEVARFEVCRPGPLPLCLGRRVAG